MEGNLRVRGHYNGLKTTMLFALMWAVIMLIWWLTGGSRGTLGIYIVIGLATTFGSYWFSDKLAIASMHAREVSEQEAPMLYKIVRELSAKAGKPMPPHLHRPHHEPQRLRHRPQPNGMRRSAARRASCRSSMNGRFAACSATSSCTFTTATS